MSGFVYAIGAPGAGAVKIGFASDPRRRLSELRCASIEDLRIIGTIPGDQSLEADLHARFSFARIRGEWFRLVGAVADFVAGLKPFSSILRRNTPTNRSGFRNPIAYIRETVFCCKTQDEFAQIIGASQATVSRWEEAQRIPGHRQSLVREKALERGEWDDRWFFAVPDQNGASLTLTEPTI